MMLRRILVLISLLLILLGVVGIIYDKKRTFPREVVALNITPGEQEFVSVASPSPDTRERRTGPIGSWAKAQGGIPEVDSVELEYPPKMISGSSANIRVRFRRTSINAPPPNQTSQMKTESLTVTPFPGAVYGPLKNAWGPDYHVYATPELSTLGFAFYPAQATRESLEPASVEWVWQIAPKEHSRGQQTLRLILKLDSESTSDPNKKKDASKPVVSKDFYIKVSDKTLLQKLWGFPPVVVGVAGFLGFKGVPDILKFVARKRKKKKSTTR